MQDTEKKSFKTLAFVTSKLKANMQGGSPTRGSITVPENKLKRWREGMFELFRRELHKGLKFQHMLYGVIIFDLEGKGTSCKK